QRMGAPLLHPFRDPELVDFLWRTPPRLLMRGGRTKGLVRDTLSRRFPAVGFDHHRKLAATDFLRSVMLSEGIEAWNEMGGALALAKLGIVSSGGIDTMVRDLCPKSNSLSIYRL